MSPKSSAHLALSFLLSMTYSASAKDCFKLTFPSWIVNYRRGERKTPRNEALFLTFPRHQVQKWQHAMLVIAHHRLYFQSKQTQIDTIRPPTFKASHAYFSSLMAQVIPNTYLPAIGLQEILKKDLVEGRRRFCIKLSNCVYQLIRDTFNFVFTTRSCVRQVVLRASGLEML